MTDYRYEHIKDFIAEHEKEHPTSRFFKSQRLKKNGERISAMRIKQNMEMIRGDDRKDHLCYILSATRKCPNTSPKKAFYYFDVDTLGLVRPAES